MVKLVGQTARMLMQSGLVLTQSKGCSDGVVALISKTCAVRCKRTLVRIPLGRIPQRIELGKSSTEQAEQLLNLRNIVATGRATLANLQYLSTWLNRSEGGGQLKQGKGKQISQ